MKQLYEGLTIGNTVTIAALALFFGLLCNRLDHCERCCEQNAACQDACHAECHKCCEDLAAKVAAIEKRQGAGAAND